MNLPLFSIVLPAYNAEKYIGSTIESILQQTVDDWELIIVNDGSTDFTYQVCQEYSSKDTRIRVISKPNGGVSSARNRGIKEACGKYITFIDADDLPHANYLESLKVSMGEAHMAIFPYLAVDSTEKVRPLDVSSKVKFERFGLCDGYIILSQKGILHPPTAKCYLNRIIKDNKLSFDNSIAMGEDLLFNLSYLEFCETISIGQNPIYNYITSNSVLSKTIRTDYADLQIMFYNKREEFCQRHNIDYSLKPYRYSILYDAYSSIAKAKNISNKEKHDALNRISYSELVKEYLETSVSFGLKECIFRLLLRFPILNKLF